MWPATVRRLAQRVTPAKPSRGRCRFPEAVAPPARPAKLVLVPVGKLGVVPEFELFDLGHIATLHRLLAELGPPAGGRVHCDLVMGVPGGMPGDAATLVQAVEALTARWAELAEAAEGAA